jgi:hypothetical protein
MKPATTSKPNVWRTPQGATVLQQLIQGKVPTPEQRKEVLQEAKAKREAKKAKG